jgi:predicted acylesterase/phospholipase RssA
MASTSYPIAFPPSQISNAKTIPNGPYYDGGIADDRVPFEAVTQFEKYKGIDINKMIIISRKRDTIPDLDEELKQFGIQELKVLSKIDIAPDNLTNNAFYKRLNELNNQYPSLADRTFVYVPNIGENFLMFDFSTLSQQYDLTSNWAKKHNPIPLRQFLDETNKTKGKFVFDVLSMIKVRK